MAAIACMSSGNFHRTFKKETGYTPFKFIETLKLKKAYQLLLSGTKQVSELTTQLGYNDYETFSRAFKKYYSIAPDDLKAIVQKIKMEMDVGPEDIFIKVFQVDNIHEIKEALDNLSSKIKLLLKDRGYSEKDIESARVMSVMPKLKTSEKNQLLVKNKYVITEDQKLWHSLITEVQHGSH